MRNSPLMITLVLVPELIICLHDYNAKDVMPHLLMYPSSSSSCIPRLNICLQNLKVETETVSIHVALFQTGGRNSLHMVSGSLFIFLTPF